MQEITRQRDLILSNPDLSIAEKNEKVNLLFIYFTIYLYPKLKRNITRIHFTDRKSGIRWLYNQRFRYRLCPTGSCECRVDAEWQINRRYHPQFTPICQLSKSLGAHGGSLEANGISQRRFRIRISYSKSQNVPTRRTRGGILRQSAGIYIRMGYQNTDGVLQT